MLREEVFARQSALRAMIHAWCMADTVTGFAGKSGSQTSGVVPPGPGPGAPLSQRVLAACASESGHVEIVV